jgi:IclR helix-turn-helix domain
MSEDNNISIALSPAQVEQVIRSAGGAGRGSLASLLSAALAGADAVDGQSPDGAHGPLHDATRRALLEALSDPQLSQSLLRGLLVLSCFGQERPWRAIIDLAQELGMSPSTTHRYVKTLRAVGLLEQDPMTREYRPATA